MQEAEKIAFKNGYQKALKECLDDLAQMHAKNPEDIPVRKVIDDVWDTVKKRLLRSKTMGFDYET